MLVSIEQHVDWTLDCIAYMRERGYRRIEPEPAAQDQWVAHVNDVANATLFPARWLVVSRRQHSR